eukprot:XP_001705270.1 Hypothetical protein GL50803_35455 [Giardia lamblia ATCC 50803]
MRDQTKDDDLCSYVLELLLSKLARLCYYLYGNLLLRT